MDNVSETAMLKCLLASAEERAQIYEHLANINKNAVQWDIMGRAVIRENEFGDSTEVVMSIRDWRELCAAVNFGV